MFQLYNWVLERNNWYYMKNVSHFLFEIDLWLVSFKIQSSPDKPLFVNSQDLKGPDEEFECYRMNTIISYDVDICTMAIFGILKLILQNLRKGPLILCFKVSERIGHNWQVNEFVIRDT